MQCENLQCRVSYTMPAQLLTTTAMASFTKNGHIRFWTGSVASWTSYIPFMKYMKARMVLWRSQTSSWQIIFPRPCFFDARLGSAWVCALQPPASQSASQLIGSPPHFFWELGQSREICAAKIGKAVHMFPCCPLVGTDSAMFGLI